MKHLNKLKCWLVGHDPYFLEIMNHECQRCNQELSYNELASPGFISRIRNYILLNYCPITDYFKKCEDCGQRFFRHNVLIDHISSYIRE